ncbi:MAG: hypothetical protein RLZZ131_357, partial [Actinomycetota bacterium]
MKYSISDYSDKSRVYDSIEGVVTPCKGNVGNTDDDRRSRDQNIGRIGEVDLRFNPDLGTQDSNHPEE